MDPTGMARRLVGGPGNEQKRFAKRTCHGRKKCGYFYLGIAFWELVELFELPRGGRHVSVSLSPPDPAGPASYSRRASGG